MRAHLAAVPLVLLLTVVACADGGPGDGGGGSIEGPTWILDAASAGSLGVEGVPKEATATVMLEDGTIGGVSFCNHYGGTYELGDEGGITIEVGFMTEMACEEPLMTLESAFLKELGEVSRYQVTGSSLLLEGGTVALTFEEDVPMDPLPLEGTLWTLDTVAVGTDAVSSTVAGTESTLMLDGGAASGNASCNTFNGSYETDGASLSFGALAMTLMACPDDVMAQEQAVLSALDSTESFSIEEDRLTLQDGAGALLLVYRGAAA